MGVSGGTFQGLSLHPPHPYLGAHALFFTISPFLREVGGKKHFVVVAF